MGRVGDGGGGGGEGKREEGEEAMSIVAHGGSRGRWVEAMLVEVVIKGSLILKIFLEVKFHIEFTSLGN